jgi:ribosomal protein S18 acetylase RimI-like enzyme
VPGSLSVRELRSDDQSLLLTATLGNMNWREARFTEQEILERTEFRHYVKVQIDRGDFGWIAEDDSIPVGAAWAQFLPRDDAGYGFVDERIPEVSLWVRADHRRRGIGRTLLRRLRATASARRIAMLSLSVESDNYARHLYLSEGFTPVARREEDDVMVCPTFPAT